MARTLDMEESASTRGEDEKCHSVTVKDMYVEIAIVYRQRVHIWPWLLGL
jgi:hypothetical protein